MTEGLKHDIRDGAMWIALDRPQSRNALTFAMYDGLAELCANVPTDGTIKAAVIYGAGGKAFAAGTDMTEFRQFKSAQDALDYEKNISRVLTAIDSCQVPTVAAINGACTGGGASIAAACDIRIASASFRFGFPIARTLGNCLSSDNLARLSALLGDGRVREMIFMARLIGAEEAISVGLISEVLDDESSLMARAAEIVSALGEMAPLTLRATKEIQRRNRAAINVDDSDIVSMCYSSEDFRNGMEAFLAKEKPKWKGK